jgi:DNA-binding GntR family transcriptional regulator
MPQRREITMRVPIRDSAYARLRDLLIAGQLAPGDKVSPRELAAQLEVSPMPVREAVQRLVAEGALVVRPQSGARVPFMSRSRFIELTTIRIALEGMAVERAAKSASIAELGRIAQLLARLQASAARARPDPPVVIRGNQRLHFAIYRSARMPVLLSLIEGLWLQIGPVLNLDLRSGTERLAKLGAHEHHALLVSSLARRDSNGARRGLVGDIESAAAYILSLDRLPEVEDR